MQLRNPSLSKYTDNAKEPLLGKGFGYGLTRTIEKRSEKDKERRAQQLRQQEKVAGRRRRGLRFGCSKTNQKRGKVIRTHRLAETTKKTRLLGELKLIMT